MNQVEHKPDGRRARHAGKKEALLSAAADYVVEHGLTNLSVRPLAAAVGLTHRTLLYYFGSRDALILAVLDEVRARDGRYIRELIMAAMTAGSGSGPGHLLRVAWSAFNAPERMPYVRLFQEVFALGLSGPPDDAWVQSIAALRRIMSK